MRVNLNCKILKKDNIYDNIYCLLLDGGWWKVFRVLNFKQKCLYLLLLLHKTKLSNYTTDVSLKVLRWQVNIRASWIWIFKSLCKLLETDVFIRRARLLIKF